jgi:hypothetical protein
MDTAPDLMKAMLGRNKGENPPVTPPVATLIQQLDARALWVMQRSAITGT